MWRILYRWNSPADSGKDYWTQERYQAAKNRQLSSGRTCMGDSSVPTGGGGGQGGQTAPPPPDEWQAKKKKREKEKEEKGGKRRDFFFFFACQFVF